MEDSTRVDLKQLKARLAKLGVYIQEPVGFLIRLLRKHDCGQCLEVKVKCTCCCSADRNLRGLAGTPLNNHKCKGTLVHMH
jgi:hypothetical protein